MTASNWLAAAAITAVLIVPCISWACDVTRRLGTLEGQANAVLEADRRLRELNAGERLTDLELGLAGVSSQDGTSDDQQEP